MHEDGSDSKMLIKKKGIRCKLKGNGHNPNFYHHYMCKAPKTGPNADLNAFMDCIVDDIQLGCGNNCDITCNKLIISACMKDNNMVDDKTWGKVDPRDGKVMALTTMLEKLEKGVTKSAANVANGGRAGGGSPSGDKMPPLKEWHKKCNGLKKVVVNHTYYWCKHHKLKDYDSFYLTSHFEEHHKVWSKDKKDHNTQYHPAEEVSTKVKLTEIKKPTPQSSLGLNCHLKQVLMTNVMLFMIFKTPQEN